MSPCSCHPYVKNAPIFLVPMRLMRRGASFSRDLQLAFLHFSFLISSKRSTDIWFFTQKENPLSSLVSIFFSDIALTFKGGCSTGIALLRMVALFLQLDPWPSCVTYLFLSFEKSNTCSVLLRVWSSLWLLMRVWALVQVLSAYR